MIDFMKPVSNVMFQIKTSKISNCFSKITAADLTLKQITGPSWQARDQMKIAV